MNAWSDAGDAAAALGKVPAMAADGNDWHEDVAGGLLHAVRLFQELPERGAGKRLMLIHAADAPPHGEKYGAFGDHHRHLSTEGGAGDPAAHAAALAEMGVNYVFIRMDETTERMEQEFAKVYAAAEKAPLFAICDLVDGSGRTLAQRTSGLSKGARVAAASRAAPQAAPQAPQAAQPLSFAMPAAPAPQPAPSWGASFSAFSAAAAPAPPAPAAFAPAAFAPAARTSGRG